MTNNPLVQALAKVMPIRVNDGPDYAEVYFADGSTHSTQAMTMNPQDWRDLQAAYDTALASSAPATGEREQIVGWLEDWIAQTLGQDISPQYLIEVLKRGDHRTQSGEMEGGEHG